MVVLVGPIACGQGTDSRIIAYVAACSEGLKLNRDGGAEPLKRGCSLRAEDRVNLGASNAMTLILLNGEIVTYQGPSQWTAPSQPPAASEKPGLSARLAHWHTVRDKVVRDAGSRGNADSSEPWTPLNLICAQFSSTASVVVWTGPMATEKRLQLIFWRGEMKLNAVTLQGTHLKNYEDAAGVRLFRSTPSVSLEGLTVTHISLSDPERRGFGDTDKAAWTNAWRVQALGTPANRRALDGTNDISGMLARGIVLEAEGQAAEALDTYLKVLDREPRHQAAHETLATFFRVRGAARLAGWHTHSDRTVNPR